MKLQEVYRTQLINNFSLFNVVLGLQNIGNPGIMEFLESSLKVYKDICRDKDRKAKAVAVTLELASDIMVMAEDCNFYNVKVITLENYDRVDFLLDKILKFTSQDGIKHFMNGDFQAILGYLQLIEGELGDNVKQTLSYMSIRNFLVLCHLKLYRFAYYYAMFIKCQIFINEGLNPRIEYSDLYKSELSLAISKERKSYSKAIKKKITGGIRDTVNKVPLVNIKEKRDDRFVGETTTLAVNSNRTVDSITEKVDDIIKKVDEQKKEENKVSVNSVAKKTTESIGSAVKIGVEVGADKAKEVVADKVKPTATKLGDKVKKVGSDVKDKMDVKFGLKNEKFDEELEYLINNGEVRKREEPKTSANVNDEEDIPIFKPKEEVEVGELNKSSMFSNVKTEEEPSVKKKSIGKLRKIRAEKEFN